MTTTGYDLDNVDLGLLFSRLDRMADALRRSNDQLFDSGGDAEVFAERTRLLDAISAIDDELRRRTWDPS